ncbi:hypothetical protein AGMMS50262_06640 [Bacteroidia bacterium]|nr:hypothetical protein AGMMS50262_06640 [Bacteroidia bacterium]
MQLKAVPANPNPVEITQPDSSKITYFVRGDEHISWIESPDGYTLLYNQDKFLVYAEQDKKGNLIPSKYIYHNVPVRSADFNRFLSETPKELKYSKEQIQLLDKIQSLEVKTARTTPVLGDKKALCVLMNFTDKKISHTNEEFEALMNQAGYYQGTARGSVKDFYRENSYGKMDLTVTIVGPYQADSTCAYFASETNYQKFALQAIQAADADIDLTEFANEDGELEIFHVLFAGYGDESVKNGAQIWSHKWELRSPVYLDGVRVYHYSCSSELRGSNGNRITSIGPICHELCHVFGADDYYDTDGNSSGGNFSGTGNWDLMANGNWNNDGDRPAHINLFQKILFGWVEPVELTTGTTITGMPNSAENPVAYIIKPSTNNEMYVLENRQRVGFDSNVPGNGLLIYHIHNSASQGRINNTGHPQQAYVVSAATTSEAYAIPNANKNSYGSVNSSRTPFSNASGRDAFTSTSIPRMFRWVGTSGEEVTDKPITEITQAGGLVSFKFMGGEIIKDTVITNLTVAETNGKILLEWEIREDSDTTYIYTLYRNGELIQDSIAEAFYTDSVSQSGVYEYCVKASENEDPVCASVTVELNSISKINATDAVVRLSPNPVSNRLFVESQSLILQIQVTDLKGRVVYVQPANAFSAVISTSSWDKGVYLVKIVGQDNLSVHKVIKAYGQ